MLVQSTQNMIEPVPCSLQWAMMMMIRRQKDILTVVELILPLIHSDGDVQLFSGRCWARMSKVAALFQARQDWDSWKEIKTILFSFFVSFVWTQSLRTWMSSVLRRSLPPKISRQQRGEGAHQLLFGTPNYFFESLPWCLVLSRNA